MTLQRRLDRIEKQLRARNSRGDDADVDSVAIEAARAILASLPAEYRGLVEDDLVEGREWTTTGGQRRLTAFVIDMAGLTAAGEYTGRLALPEIVCESSLDTYATADKNGVALSGDFHPANVASWGECDGCGWRWWNREIRDALRQCPGCDMALDLYLSSHDLDVLQGSYQPWRPGDTLPAGLIAPADKLNRTKASIWRRACDFYGVEGAEQWLQGVAT